LISVSVAPESYFFCASAPLLDAASIMNAAEAIANLLKATGISNLPWWICVSVMFFFVDLETLHDAGGIEYYLAIAIKKKPLRNRRRGCFFSSQPGSDRAGPADVSRSPPR
jgi:hypothetical protein